MAKKNDIGTLFENKLKEGEKSPNSALWEKINTSLEKEERKRKKFFFFWLTGGGIVGLISLWVLFSNPFFTATFTDKPNSNTILTEERTVISEPENEKLITSTAIKDSINSEDNDAEKLLELKGIKEDSIQKAKIIIGNKTKSITSKKKSIEETFEVSEKYYYYNSRDGKQIVTESKKTIDSLIFEATKTLDSTMIKKKDSL
jgi:hypothetical protein